MKIPISWLKDYIDVSNEKKLMDGLTAIGHMQDGPPKEIAGDTVYDLEVRQNRSDCLSLIGIAREAAAILSKKVKYPKALSTPLPSLKQKTKIDIQDKNLCYRFNTLTIEGIRVAESPKWLSQKLESYGIKSVNNLVDITNFVMVETGQPLHAFDLAKVKDSTLIIRKAKKGESITVLGGRKINFSDEDFVIADTQKPLAFGGIIGGEESGIKNDTVSIILEAATYNQAIIRKSSLRHGLRTEGSTRHEKFRHPHSTELALQRSLELILEICGGTIVDHTDSYPKSFASKFIQVNILNIQKIGGVDIDLEFAKEVLGRLEIAAVQKTDIVLAVEAPYFRTDLEQEADIIEEVLRIYGYENLPSRLPTKSPPQNIDSQQYLLEEYIKDILTAAGYDEQITEPLTNEVNPITEPIMLENSLNSDKTMLRTTLKTSLLSALKHQQKFHKQAIKLFEIGKIYFREKSYEEKGVLGIITSGQDYFELKGIFEVLNDRFETTLSENDLNIQILDPQGKIYFLEILLERIKNIKVIKPLSEAPHIILQDISFFTGRDTSVSAIIENVKRSSKLLSSVELGEEPKVIDDRKAIFLKLVFSSLKQNLTKEQIVAEKKKITEDLQKNFQARLR